MESKDRRTVSRRRRPTKDDKWFRLLVVLLWLLLLYLDPDSIVVVRQLLFRFLSPV